MSFRRHHIVLDTHSGSTTLNHSAYMSLVVSVVEATVSRVFDIPEGGLALASRGPADVAFARQVAMYLAHVAGGLTLTDVGRCFGRDRTTVGYACLTIEERRDDPRLDRALDVIEAILKRVAPPASLELEARRRPYQRRRVA
jgi:chromosomal replication initiation ATPase DnaA